ncbi:hypothetical protein EMIHUDRAFT_105639 [Emiliania huxleyi CCMP1516]|uniref:Plastid lipid-associated protein/fibrillin conserved domain-containing protein n=2 Tax=Emiliania huxleyi TaxID=2903 RepID=A0A0D3IDC2_EMIH1|nr:hypothetical protein EMIHUDRAFT_105639 [Emiliania huxleyi CCMP1516]EOD09257.1 hypothetical protein EMIHUDRAFT_105639 [Emiliania huxleyi CCMP1516]|eukprot:XP_005761686.1 hypothetical protein EMIHUDRAFT_105639 [Emiliania huxleyi CCMP1516]
MTMVDSWYDAGQRLSTAAAMRAASPAAGGSSRLEAELESTKAALLKVALLSGRGAWARPSERVAAAQLVESLEQAAEQNEEAPSLRDGTWELVLSDVEPFRASTFFLALGEAVEALIQKGASDGALTVHALATGGGEVGRVAHVVEGGGGFVCTCRSHAPRSLLSWIGDQTVPSGEVFSRVLEPLGGGPSAQLRLSYSDGERGKGGGRRARLCDRPRRLEIVARLGELMVWRAPKLGDHFFVFVRGEEETWPAMEETRRRQASSATQSAVGSAFALGMLNPFFSRAAGARKS